MRLGIDFGTTRTVVAAVHDGRHPVAAFDVDGEFHDHVPGIAAIAGGELVVGWRAHAALADGTATHAIRSIKRVAGALAPDAEVPGLPGTTALELLTRFFAELRHALVERSSLTAHGELEVMLSAPANAASRQRWMTLEACRRAGFTPIGLVNEPTAAAIEFASHHLAAVGPRSPKRYVVVYDLGGGTFDTSAVSLEGRRFDLIASEGLARVGGDDFDEVILAAAHDAAGVPHVVDAAGLERARAAKESLRPTSKKLLVELGDTATAQLDVADLYARCEPLIDRTVALTETLLERLATRFPDARYDDTRALGGIYLVGGGAAFPAVTRALRAKFGKKLQLAPQPFAATAVGLALAADPATQLLVREATTRHFGVWRERQGGDDKVFDPLLAKDSTERVVERRYRPTHTIGHLRFLECGALDEHGQPVQDLVPLVDVYFPYAPELADRTNLAELPVERHPAPARDEIRETYTYGADGTLSLRIENCTHGYTRTFELGALRPTPP